MANLRYGSTNKAVTFLFESYSCSARNNEHFHLMSKSAPGDVAVSSRPYRPDDKILEWGKVLFRTDVWDKEHYPHVLDDTA